ncbi:MULTISPECIES: hypothetical protein [unclassified Rhodococcus (in: high G+C Gram-positive bacteria)]|uniref:hypothetical protein n=1 Tax=unclassified Rhodococcus (in: high G+C Gram-positive bacteria) TaxID=192944 RepID=UPI00113FCA7D|nr:MULTISPECIES: hypothetical protein [unclassified Rhodococcus (in: high G+C Gram-positive bacteria)]
MPPPSLDSGPIRASPDAETPAVPSTTSSRPRRRAVAVRSAVSGASAVLLLIFLMWAPHAAPSTFGESMPGSALAAHVLDAIDVTAVLIAVAALAVVALIRKLPFGIGVVIACTIGAVVTSALAREIMGATTASADLPSGQLVAVASLLGAASMVASAAWRPVILGLGTVATLAVAAAALIVGSASITGIVSAASIVFVWWPACSIVMLFSPDAAAREARNPLDTAALAVRRKTGRSR